MLWLAHAFASIAVPLTIYSLEPRFQVLLRPAAAYLNAGGITSNQVTVAACLASMGPALFLAWGAANAVLFLLLHVWLFMRMAFNAIDGMPPAASQALLVFALTVLIALTMVNRVRGALRELPG